MVISAIKNRISNFRFREGSVQKGMVFIPDISGFTKLVRHTDLNTGKIITYELLSALIHSNTLNLEISEIEGDAVFFYKRKSIPDAKQLYQQFETMKVAFDKKVLDLQKRFHLELNLTLKAIAHYGEMSEFSIEGFRKLYGEVVVEAHRLLKNHIPARSYLLITDELMAVTRPSVYEDSFYTKHSSKLCELYERLRNLCFTYILFDYLEPP